MPTVYARIVGAPAIAAAVDVFYARVLADAALAPFFADVPMDKQRAKMAALLTMVTGGPNQYAGRDMRTAHAPLVAGGLDGSHFDAVVAHRADTLTALGVGAGEVAEVGRIADSTRADVLGR